MQCHPHIAQDRPGGWCENIAAAIWSVFVEWAISDVTISWECSQLVASPPLAASTAFLIYRHRSARNMHYSATSSYSMVGHRNCSRFKWKSRRVWAFAWIYGNSIIGLNNGDELWVSNFSGTHFFKYNKRGVCFDCLIHFCGSSVWF